MNVCLILERIRISIKLIAIIIKQVSKQKIQIICYLLKGANLNFKICYIPKIRSTIINNNKPIINN